MAEVVQEISRDYDYDAIDVEACNNQMEWEIDQLLKSYASVADYGLNPTAHAILTASRLLQGTALESMASASVLHTGGSSEQSQIALESIASAIKDKAAAWGAKLLSFFHTMSSKVSDTFSHVWDKISSTAKSIIHGAWDKTKALGRTIKAHPYKTIAAVVGAMGAVVGVLALVGSPAGLDPASSAWQSFIHRVKDGAAKIKMPGMSIAPDVIDGGKLVVDIHNADTVQAVSGTAEQLGWTRSAVDGILGTLNRIWSGLKNAVTSFGRFIGKSASVFDQRDPAKAAGDYLQKKTGSGAAGWVTQQIVNKGVLAALWMMTGSLYKIFSRVLSKAYAMISETFHSLKPATE